MGRRKRAVCRDRIGSREGAKPSGRNLCSAAVEFPVIKDWLEIEAGISPLFRPGQTEWQADLLFKKPFTINERVEFMIGVGPQVSYATFGGGTKVAGEIELEWMLWPSAERKFGWFVAPTYGYSFSK